LARRLEQAKQRAGAWVRLGLEMWWGVEEKMGSGAANELGLELELLLGPPQMV
jgi:hypothetical protein